MQSIPLTGSDANGYLSLSRTQVEGLGEGIPNDETRPKGAWDYPFYWDPTEGLPGEGGWVIIIAEPLSENETYSEDDLPYPGCNLGSPDPQADPDCTFLIENVDLTDPDFGNFDFGALEYDDAALTGTGEESIPASAVSFATVDYALDTNNLRDFVTDLVAQNDFDPFGTPRNDATNNEFGFAYGIKVSNLSGDGLTFQDGQLVAIDLRGDLTVDVYLMGPLNPPPFPKVIQIAWDTPSESLFQANSFEISGNRLTFSFDQTADAPTTLLGSLTDNRLVINRTGTIAAVSTSSPGSASVPVLPFGAAVVFVIGLLALGRRGLLSNGGKV
ncbi:MAG: hypothetical protein AAF387_06665 [Pseudomonadota bacterium]